MLSGSQLVSGELVVAVLVRDGKAVLMFVDEKTSRSRVLQLIAYSVGERLITPVDSSKTEALTDAVRRTEEKKRRGGSTREAGVEEEIFQCLLSILMNFPG